MSDNLFEEKTINILNSMEDGKSKSENQQVSTSSKNILESSILKYFFNLLEANSDDVTIQALVNKKIMSMVDTLEFGDLMRLKKAIDDRTVKTQEIVTSLFKTNSAENSLADYLSKNRIEGAIKETPIGSAKDLNTIDGLGRFVNNLAKNSITENEENS